MSSCLLVLVFVIPVMRTNTSALLQTDSQSFIGLCVFVMRPITNVCVLLHVPLVMRIHTLVVVPKKQLILVLLRLLVVRKTIALSRARTSASCPDLALLEVCLTFATVNVPMIRVKILCLVVG